MRKLLMSAAFGLALAEPVTAGCESFGQLAEELMTARQLGLPMSRVLDVAGAAWGDEDTGLLYALVEGAYAEPRYTVPENQRRAVQDYRNEVELACYQARS